MTELKLQTDLVFVKRDLSSGVSVKDGDAAVFELEKTRPRPHCHSVKRNLSFRGSDRCHCRGNPYPKDLRERIATPVCGLARNDKVLN